MSFDVQLWVIMVAGAAALVRRRLNILIFSANHFILLRAFQNIEEHGQPTAYHYLPPVLFAPSMLEAAGTITATAALMLLVAAVVPVPVAPRTEPLAPIPPWVLTLIGGYFVFLFFSTRTLFQTTYASSDQVLYGASAGGGIYTLAWALVIYEARRRVDEGTLQPARAMAMVIAAVFFLDFIKGSTGIATGILVTAGVLMFLPGVLGESAGAPRPSTTLARARTMALAGALMGAVALFVAFLRTLRSTVATQGLLAASERSLERLLSLSSETSGEGLEAASNGTQGAAHVLMCTFLYDTGHSREWRSIWGPIEYTFKPSILIGPLGLERSREAAWELGDYFIHGGGINVFGEFYWNGGMFCVVVVGAALVAFLLWVDVMSRRSWVWLGVACAIGPALLQGYGYGFAQVFRGAANGFLFVVPLIAYVRWAGSHRPPLAVRRSPSPIPRNTRAVAPPAPSPSP